MPLVLLTIWSQYLLFSNTGKNTSIFFKIRCTEISHKHVSFVRVRIVLGAGILGPGRARGGTLLGRSTALGKLQGPTWVR